MFHPRRIIFILLRVIIIMSYVQSVWNEASEKDNSPYGLRKINSNRKKIGPVAMLQAEHRNLDENNVPNTEEIFDRTAEDNADIDDVSGVVRKDPTPTISVSEDQNNRKEKGLPPIISSKALQDSNKYCWMRVNAKQHFKRMDGLDYRFASVRKKFREAAEKDNFSQDMLDMMLKTRGVAEREIHNAAGDPSFIPAGINLGGYSMMRLQDSILNTIFLPAILNGRDEYDRRVFYAAIAAGQVRTSETIPHYEDEYEAFFHRMKLRNNTHFRVNTLQNDLANMVLTAQLSLNDLHILGAYERATTPSDSAELFYTPTYGEVELLLKNVEYKMEGRYRMLQNKLAIELIVSNIALKDILMTYQNEKKANRAIALKRKNIDQLLDRLKLDLDKWLKDYFNDYLMYFGLIGEKANTKFLRYNQEKTIAINEYADEVLEKIVERIKKLKLGAVRLPDFSVTAVNGMQLKLTQGVLRGLETIHRRSLATGKKERKLRKLNAVVGFSSLKATYQYEAVFNTGVPPINGMLVVTADELIAHMGLILSKKPEKLVLLFDSIQQIKPESLTLEGPANRIIGNFKNLLERHVFTFISNAIIHNVKMLRTLTKCEPSLNAYFQNEMQENERKLDINPNDKSTDHVDTEKTLNSNSNENAAMEANSSMNNDTQKSEENFSEKKENGNLNSNISDTDDQLNAENKSTLTNKNKDAGDKTVAKSKENNKSTSNNSDNEDDMHTAMDINIELENKTDK